MKKLPWYFLFVKLYYIMIKDKDTLKYFIPLVLITLAVLSITYSHHNGLIIDCGREAYYPQEILNGKVLYKDLFNIYGPFSYLFNAILYKILGNNLNTLYMAGSFCAFGIITTLFFIAKRVLSASFGFYIGCFAIAIGIIPVYVFNYVYPYSFGMTYGLLACLVSIFAFIKFEDKKNILYLSLGTFFAGLAVCCKYEFIAFLLIIPYILLKTKINFKSFLISLFSFLIIPILCFGTLFIEGLRFENLIEAFNITKVMAQTQTLNYFYIHSGIFFHKQTLGLIISTFLVFAILFSIYMAPILFKNKLTNPAVNLILTYTGICLLFVFKIGSFYDLYAFTPCLLLILILINYKKLWKDLPLFVLVIGSFLISLKIFWGLILNSYGIYYLPLIILSIFALYKDKFNQKEIDYIGFFILVLAILVGFSNCKFYLAKNHTLSTQKGIIYVKEKHYKTTKKLFEYIEKNTKKEDKILILPEGMMINYLTDRKTDDFYNTLLPLYEETFGNEQIINHLKKSMPEYVIFNSWDSSDYYFSIICKDYLFDFCNFVKKNYKEEIKLLGDFSYTIYKKK